MPVSTVRRPRLDAAITNMGVSAFTIPTDAPEADGTFDWHATTIVVVEVEGGGNRGLGYSYIDQSAATLIRSVLADIVRGCNAMDVQSAWIAMVRAIRNIGRPGVASCAIAAVDAALWDLKSRLLDLPLLTVLGAARPSVDVYGSGGFTSYSTSRLQEQLAAWVGAGISRVKMKIGRNAHADIDRIAAARQAIGADAELLVDANGAYDRKQALWVAEHVQPFRVTWFEEPVSSDDLDGLRMMRDRVPPPIEIAAGEYGYDLPYFRRMLEARAVDVLQADATRCAGITGFLQIGTLADAFAIPLSAHTAPSLHLSPCCASSRVRHLEYFHDHVRIEQMLFDGAQRPRADGKLYPDLSRPGLGLELKRADAARFEVH
jgi:L-alanine-DL-glutamate epimerase-like enolase superfamily enzyme